MSKNFRIPDGGALATRLEINFCILAPLKPYPLCSHFLLVIPAKAGIHSGWEDGYLP
jgi:hypothetical protein